MLPCRDPCDATVFCGVGCFGDAELLAFSQDEDAIADVEGEENFSTPLRPACTPTQRLRKDRDQEWDIQLEELIAEEHARLLETECGERLDKILTVTSGGGGEAGN